MEQKLKEQIAQRLRTYVAKYPSQNKAVGSLKGTSAGTVSNILNGRWENISEEMWKKVGDQVGTVANEDGWQIVETVAYQEISYALNDAQQWKNVTWVVGEAGCGKTTTARIYAEEHREVFYLQCSEDLYKGEFVREIARLVGIRGEGFTVRELWKAILDNLIQMEAPLLVFDEADKLTDQVLYFFITLYNRLEGHCGIILTATPYLRKRVERGVQLSRKGYAEIYSRIGRKFVPLPLPGPEDIAAICTANGLTESSTLSAIAGEAEGDLRRVKRSVWARLKGGAQ